MTSKDTFDSPMPTKCVFRYTGGLPCDKPVVEGQGNCEEHLPKSDTDCFIVDTKDGRRVCAAYHVHRTEATEGANSIDTRYESFAQWWTDERVKTARGSDLLSGFIEARILVKAQRDEIERLRAVEQLAKDFADGTKEVRFADNLMGNDDVVREIARIILTGEN